MSKRSAMRPAWIALLATAALVVTGCSAGTSSPAGKPAGAADGIVVEGKGVTANEYGGLQLKLSEPVDGGELRFGISAPVMSLDPAGSVGSSIIPVALSIYGQLLRFDADGAVAPAIAKSMTTDDGVTWTMTLPKGITFQDGTAFDADAVISHVTRVAAEGSRSSSAGDARNVASMTAPDAQTVVFKLKTPSAFFDSLFTDGSLAMVPSPTAVAKFGEQYGLNPVGAGPFTLESFSPGSDIKLVKNDDYYVDGLPHLDRLTFVAAFDNSARLSGITAGDLDVGVSKVAADFAQAKSAGLTVLEQPQYKAYRLLLNLEDPALGDIRVREALNLAVDRDAVNAAVFGGGNFPSEGMFNRVHPHFVETGWPTTDVKQAKKLVNDYESETGTQLKLDLTVPEGTEFTQIAAVLQQMYQAAGIDVEYAAAPPPSLVAASASGQYQMQMREFAIPPETFNVLTTYFGENSSFNHSYASDATLNKLLDEANATLDPTDRAKLIGPMQEALAGWQPMVPIVTIRSAFIVSSAVQGFPGGIPNNSAEMFDATQVWVKK